MGDAPAQITGFQPALLLQGDRHGLGQALPRPDEAPGQCPLAAAITGASMQ